MIYKYNKLVRDKIPSEINAKPGRKCSYFIMLLLTEEVGELAKAIRKDATDLKIDSNKIGNYDSIESKIADVFIVLNSICTALDINLFDAIYNKERINEDRKWS